MILTCPECSTRYEAKSETIGINGRTVRCHQCSATWFVPAPEDKLSTPDALQLADIKAQEAVEKNQTELEAVSHSDQPKGSAVLASPSLFKPDRKSADAIMRDKVDAAKRRTRLRTILFIWLIPLSLIGLAFLAVLIGRDQITDRFPGTIPFYNAVGIKMSLTGLEIEPPIIRIARVNGEQTIVINGTIRNISRDIQPLPYLILSLHTEGGDEVALWRVEFNRANLKSGESLDFASEYPNPPVDVKRLKYRLGDQIIGSDSPIVNQSNTNSDETQNPSLLEPF